MFHTQQPGKDDHSHCWHIFRGPIWMVVPDGHIVQQCCECQTSRTIHADHAHDRRIKDCNTASIYIQTSPRAKPWR